MAQSTSKSSSGSRKRWKFEFGPAGMIGLCGVMLLVMAWAFILGILVGRGYRPESVIAELGQMVPVTSKDPAKTTSGPLLPEELRFFETLQEKISPILPAVAPDRKETNTPPPPPTKPQPVLTVPAQTASGVAPAGEKQSEAAQAHTPAADSIPAVPRQGQSQEPLFDYVYQIASFQNDAQARAMQQRVNALGHASSVEVSMVNGEKWYRVLVSLRGTTKDAAGMKEELQKLGIERPFIRTKKPI